MKKVKYAFACVWATLLITGCSQKQQKESIDPVPVKVFKVETKDLNMQRDFSGTVEEMSGTALSFTTGGTLKRIFVSTGKKVHKGELIAIVDEATLRNAYNISAAALSQAKDSYQRMKQLHDRGSLPEMQWVEVQSKLDQAIASEKISRKNLEDCKLYAPFSGVISEKFADTGENIMPGAPVVKLVTIDRIKVKIAVPENEISDIEEGQNVKFTVMASGNDSFEGRIMEKGVSANPLARSYEVKAVADNHNGKLIPGMICRVQVYKNRAKTSVFLLPTRIVQLDESNRSFVWVNEKGIAKRKFVSIGEFSGQNIVIEKGLASGDEVITEGQQKVSENTPVNVIK